jgi:hypothetical protein
MGLDRHSKGSRRPNAHKKGSINRLDGIRFRIHGLVHNTPIALSQLLLRISRFGPGRDEIRSRQASPQPKGLLTFPRCYLGGHSLNRGIRLSNRPTTCVYTINILSIISKCACAMAPRVSVANRHSGGFQVADAPSASAEALRHSTRRRKPARQGGTALRACIRPN